jgi:hypothetical protein
MHKTDMRQIVFAGVKGDHPELGGGTCCLGAGKAKTQKAEGDPPQGGPVDFNPGDHDRLPGL